MDAVAGEQMIKYESRGHLVRDKTSGTVATCSERKKGASGFIVAEFVGFDRVGVAAGLQEKKSHVVWLVQRRKETDE